MNCAACEWSVCCKHFSFYYYSDGEKIWTGTTYPFDDITVTLAEHLNNKDIRFCVLQLADGKCLVHEEKPRICRDYRC